MLEQSIRKTREYSIKILSFGTFYFHEDETGIMSFFAKPLHDGNQRYNLFSSLLSEELKYEMFYITTKNLKY